MDIRQWEGMGWREWAGVFGAGCLGLGVWGWVFGV